MVTLALDTSFQYLTVVLFDETNQPLASYSEKAVHQQSELLLPTIDGLYKKCNLSPRQTECIVITEGPGSYTGLRITMTFAKTMALFNHIKIKTINALDLYYGKPDKDGYCVMDARAKRVYMSHYTNGKRDDLGVVPIDALDIDSQSVVMGEGELVGRTTAFPDFVESFRYWLDHAMPVSNPAQLSPLYLKESDAYGIPAQRNA